MTGFEFAGRIDDVRIYDRALAQGEIQMDMATSLGAPDTTAPSVPTGLTANPVSTSQINLSWTASTDNIAVTGYQVFRDGTQIGTATTTSFSDSGLAANTLYSYAVRAIDAAGNLSALSSPPVSATTPCARHGCAERCADWAGGGRHGIGNGDGHGECRG